MDLPMFLKPYFWDVDFESLTVSKNPAFVILRVIDRGNTDALRWLVKQYGLEPIRDIVIKSREISRKTAGFWALIFGLDTKKIVCLQKPYSPTPFGP